MSETLSAVALYWQDGEGSAREPLPSVESRLFGCVYQDDAQGVIVCPP